MCAWSACFCLLGDSFQDVLSNEPATRKHSVRAPPLDSNLHSLSRQLIELRIEHADLDATIDRLAEGSPQDELLLRRLKKRRLALRDQITRLENDIDPKEPA
ncbi:hypothetical protein VVAX_03686 [Variovorax paradoxus]|uniref:DUF465 domain-containing protein n=1 Tax=Variovorax paradoxus TaxID=34073 RepID=A0A679J595_VARPD|nr:hypothetical protein VVAX_03686 [Variovorax paradoxus]